MTCAAERPRLSRRRSDRTLKWMNAYAFAQKTGAKIQPDPSTPPVSSSIFSSMALYPPCDRKYRIRST